MSTIRWMETRVQPASALRSIARLAIAVFMAAAAIFGSSGLANAAVTVDQQPLIIAKPLPPNIVLMLDDSGSMAWDFMPDICYLYGVDCTQGTINNDAMIDSSNNGVYYNPSITYPPPVKVDGTSYPNAAGLTNAWIDGFNVSTGAVDLTAYNGTYDTGYVNYSTSFTTTTTQSYSGVSSKSSCKNNYYYQDPNATGYSYNSGTKVCTLQYQSTIGLFQYSTGAAAGPYTVHYVANTNCGSQANCVIASDTSGVAAPAGIAAGQNIANWFSYYHTRILMAKSGLMNAFVTIDPTFRIGFGSIDGANIAGLPSDTYSYYDAYNGQTNYIAQVKPFGDGTSGTQKLNFWNWVIGEQPGGGTPLRQALDQVGQYYQTAQPWQTSSSDTTQLACRQSYAILTTDGFWNDSFSGPGNADGTSGPTVTGPNNQTYTYTAAAPYTDGYSDTLADVAMKYWKTDLRPTVLNEVPPSTEDPAFWQHMTTFTLGLGFTPTGISPAGTTISQIFSWANGGAAISGFSWPQPSANSINNIADLAHAAVDGHGGFYSATSPQAFSSGLADALKRASERVGTGASLAANSTKLALGTVTYQANYYTGKWKGDLKAFAVDPNTGAIATTPTWTAVTALPTAANRNIYTYNPNGNNANSRYIAFQSTSTLSNAEYTALGGSTTASNSTGMINYLRGDNSLEISQGGTYRNRDTPLGDIVNSQPVYVGAPDANLFYGQTFTGSSSYAAFASTESTRSPQVYVTANDGMLHAFNAATGAETYAYLPGAVITSGLSTLSNPSYGASSTAPHQFFNDGEVTTADIYVSSGSGSWHTILVGTTGRGAAKAIYALDITDPTSVQFLWERSASDGKTNAAYIGQMTGKPVIAQTADKQWQVLMGNGYNSTNGTAALLQFALTTSAGVLDTAGTLSVVTTNTSTSNGLAAPAVWIGNPANGISTTAYAGDLLGNVWSFDLANNSSSLLFTAKDSGGKVQPITAGMLAGKDPVTNNVWLFFGTGEYLNAADLTDMSTQTWYGIIAQAGAGQPASLVTNLSNGRSALVQRKILAEVAATAGNATATPPVLPTLGARGFTPKPTPSDMTGESGWYIDLTSPVNGAEGERMVTPNQFQGSLLIGTSRIPQASDVCNPTGRGWIMAIDPFTGTNPTSKFFDINGDGKFDSADMITLPDGTSVPVGGVGFNSLPNNPIFVGNTMLVSFDNGSTSSVSTAGSVGSMNRVSWRELINQ
ncbi:MAG: pilus assembly protein [Halothiobacillus sp.]